MTVIEVRGRGGQLVERFRSGANSIRVGRALDNDLVIEDEHVSPHHLELVRSEAGFHARDLGSLNGLHFVAGAGSNGLLASGEALQIGHTTLRVFDEHHPVAPALPFDLAEERLASLEAHRAWGGLAAISAIGTLTAMFWSTSAEFHPTTALAPIATEFLVTAGTAAIWALVGRLLRHQAHFFAHFAIWIGCTIGWALGGLVARTLAYNASSEALETALERLFFLLVLGATLWASLTLSTLLRGRRRLLAAFGVALGVVGLQLAQQVQLHAEFQSGPDYYGRIQAPAALWAPGRPEHALAERLKPLFDRADEGTLEPDA